jgi:GNAT superfamily N-acetyltransferase
MTIGGHDGRRPVASKTTCGAQMTERDISFTQANLAEDRDALLDINVEYGSWVTSEIEKTFHLSIEALLGSSVPEYISGALDKICGEKPPSGVFYLVEVGGKVSGMGGLRRLGDGVAEIKRIYVREESRGRRLGETILQRLLNDARDFGYKKVLLDTGPFMKSAHRIYEAAGFLDRGAYP